MTTSSLSFPVERSTSPATEAERRRVLADPGFGKHFTDHMVLATWTRDAGWHDAKVVPYGPFTLDPSTAVFHYGQEIFEGMKAYRHADGSVWTFRPEQNAARFARSAHRLGLPELPEADFLESIRAMVDVDQVWVPEHGGESSLYLRPFMIGTESGLGVRPSMHVTYCVIASPAGAYFAGGIKPVSLWVTPQYTRAAPGGTGAAKCGGNYAASLAAQLEAQSQGCDQVVFLDAVERRYIEELGGMNLFFVRRDGTVMTPQLSGSILEGVTRSSILEVARELGHEVEERRISLDEWREGVGSGEITEVFACGTAAVVTPVGRLAWLDGEVVGSSEPGEVTMTIRNQLLDIQTGRAEDTHGWLHRLV
ncbi:branched-chain amino acid aminotransferase [Arsenicicoccus dermatophilus]|uniref:branched-chain amino acid aminotransferase n=1 Tax=Arsenicicoccus dermatophilus TaxID=1076331 RepID=UPI001F4CFFD1|nr:branched-chain amino acid aminotransferase [Arsenicicoccus dermatophilus]MCH8612961.1 branched-chain amino acid aminotransferase [Arsenicicoccus dermatophilus]